MGSDVCPIALEFRDQVSKKQIIQRNPA